VEKGRGKKSKKTGWHLSLGLKEIIFAGLGVAALMMMSFILGALAGRGDIYRAASSLGLVSPEGLKVAQWSASPEVAGGSPALSPAPESAPAPTPLAAVASTPGPAATTPPQAPATVPVPVPLAATKPERPAPVTGSVAPLSPPVETATKKKEKTGPTQKDHKTKEEELRRVRQEMVKKLKFQNSFDTAPKARLPKAKEHEKAQAKAKSQSVQVQVGQYRNEKEAQAKVAELQKKGINATIKKSKDSKGLLYTVSKSGSAPQADASKLAKKPPKSSSTAKKPAQ
jgi:hypothetical protein